MKKFTAILPILLTLLCNTVYSQMKYQKVVSANNFKLEIELEKTEYKTFEPVTIFCRYINNSSENDTLYHDFDSSILTPITFYLKSENEESFKSGNARGIIHYVKNVKYVLFPGDSVLFTLSQSFYKVNSYWNSNESYGYFHKYLQEGNYEITAQIEFDGTKSYSPALSSNSLNFKITEINKDDEHLLSDYANKNRSYDSNLTDKFPESPFNEYYALNDVMTEVSKYRYDFPNDGAKNAVIKYIKAYPYSIKTLTPVSRYLNLVQSKSAMDEFREIANVYPGSFLKEYLYNSIFEKKILFNYPENENPPGIKDERKN